MTITYEDVTPTLIPNTTMQKGVVDGVHRNYIIRPVDGYVLHDKGRDWTVEDEETGEEIVVRGYTSGQASCGANYDFTANPREFWAELESDVPADQIFSGSNPDHEVM